MNDEIFKTTEKIIRQIKIPRNSYINQAVDFFNRIQKRKKLGKILKEESKRVSAESLKMLQAFEAFEEDLP